MKYIKLIPIILKNLVLITYDETKSLLQRSKIARWIFAVIVAVILGAIGYFVFWRVDPNDPDLSLWQASRVGEKTTHQLMVQIENKNCPKEIASGCYERGDIVLIKPADFQFSDGEKESFLILKMDITDKQAEVLVKSLEQKAKEQPKDLPEGMKDAGPQMEQLKMRKYVVNLKEIGIGDDVTSGKVVDKVFGWKVVDEKE